MDAKYVNTKYVNEECKLGDGRRSQAQPAVYAGEDHHGSRVIPEMRCSLAKSAPTAPLVVGACHWPMLPAVSWAGLIGPAPSRDQSQVA